MRPSDPRSCEFFAARPDPVDKIPLFVEDPRCFEGTGEEVPDDLLIHRVAHADIGNLAIGRPVPVLRRGGRARDEQSRPGVDAEVVEEELARSCENGPCAIAQESLIASELVVFPQVSAEPCPSEGPQAPYRSTDGHGEGVDVAGVMDDPAICAIEFPRRLPTTRHQSVDEIEERFVTLRQPGQLGGPVVHLQIDVGVVVAVPGRGDVMAPDSLEIRGLAADA